MRSARLHLQVLFLTAGLGIVLAVAFNALMDPLSLLDSPVLPGMNAHKTTVGESGERRYKAAQIERIKPEILILGTSRVEVGMPGDHPAFGGRRVFNAGLSGTNMLEIDRVFAFALSRSRPQEILLGLDFLTFSKRRGFTADFADSAFANPPASVTFIGWRQKARYLFSVATIGLSWQTLLDNLKGRPERYNIRGEDQFFERLPSPDHRSLFGAALRGMLTNVETYAGYSYDPGRMQLLWRMAEVCAREGIRLRLFITPIHAQQFEALRAMGLDETYRKWMRELADGMETLRATHPDAQISLWDFSGYHAFATETVPTRGKTGAAMLWYWESSHFKRELGALLLDRLYDQPEARVLPMEFGVALNAAQVAGRLALLESRRADYAARQPGEVQSVERLAACTRRIWGTLCADCSMTGSVQESLSGRLCAE